MHMVTDWASRVAAWASRVAAWASRVAVQQRHLLLHCRLGCELCRLQRWQVQPPRKRGVGELLGCRIGRLRQQHRDVARRWPVVQWLRRADECSHPASLTVQRRRLRGPGRLCTPLRLKAVRHPVPQQRRVHQLGAAPARDDLRPLHRAQQCDRGVVQVVDQREVVVAHPGRHEAARAQSPHRRTGSRRPPSRVEGTA